MSILFRRMLMVASSFLPPGLMMEVRVQFLSFLLILFHLSSLPLPLHLLLHLHLPFFLIHCLFLPSGQANLITTSKTITVPGQIGMRPPLHCTNEFSTCIWFTNDTKIPGEPQFHQIAKKTIHQMLGSQLLLGQNTLFGSISVIS